MSATPNPLLAQPVVSPAQQAATQILNAAPQQFNMLLGNWSSYMNAVWKNPRATPSQVVAALGTNAAAAFDLSAKTVAFLESVNPGCTAAVSANVLAFTANPDGTVTLNA